MKKGTQRHHLAAISKAARRLLRSMLIVAPGSEPVWSHRGGEEFGTLRRSQLGALAHVLLEALSTAGIGPQQVEDADPSSQQVGELDWTTDRFYYPPTACKWVNVDPHKTGSMREAVLKARRLLSGTWAYYQSQISAIDKVHRREFEEAFVECILHGRSPEDFAFGQKRRAPNRRVAEKPVNQPGGASELLMIAGTLDRGGMIPETAASEDCTHSGMTTVEKMLASVAKKFRDERERQKWSQ